jgi:hypothetical protein
MKVREKNHIYVHTTKEWRKCSELIGGSEYPIGLDVGMTEHRMFEYRFANGDYSHFFTKPEVYAMLEVHPDLTDYAVHDRMLSHHFLKNPDKEGSHDFFVTFTHQSYEDAIEDIVKIIRNLNDYYYEYEKKTGQSPGKFLRERKGRKGEAHRVVPMELIIYQTNLLQNLPKNVKIFVPYDAHGAYCEYLINQGFVNIFTHNVEENSSLPLYVSENENVNLISNDEFMSQAFNVVIGNPPYGNAGNLAIRFLNCAADRVVPGGIISLVLPTSIRKPSSQNKIRKDLHCVEDIDCDDKSFPGGINAVVQRWEVRSELRTKIETYKTHPDFEFVKKGDPSANLFVMRTGHAGKVLTENFQHYEYSHFFIHAKTQQVIDTIKELEPKLIELASQTNGRNHVSKHELIESYIEYQEQAQ